ncbi:hypothetical protein D1831_10605 [Lactiplantibacillus garii]|uniref:Uncharacterized protein n=1 Tax=Lactiplantibacillus garii TaxID=2306423 RepID=A0A3R8KDK6_9LACO|nr:hypothetical protein D1831_10605 [Lactiplantibacillus garii]
MGSAVKFHLVGVFSRPSERPDLKTSGCAWLQAVSTALQTNRGRPDGGKVALTLRISALIKNLYF